MGSICFSFKNSRLILYKIDIYLIRGAECPGVLHILLFAYIKLCYILIMLDGPNVC